MIYFLRTVRNALLLHFLQLTLPCKTFMLFVLILDLHLRQTNISLCNLACASGNFTILFIRSSFVSLFFPLKYPNKVYSPLQRTHSLTLQVFQGQMFRMFLNPSR